MLLVAAVVAAALTSASPSGCVRRPRAGSRVARAVAAPPGADRRRTRRRSRSPSLVVDALRQGVVVLDREDRAVLVNPAARAMGMVDVDRLAFGELVERRARSARPVSAMPDLGRPADRPPGPRADRAVGGGGPLPGRTGASVRWRCCSPTSASSAALEAVRRDFVANVCHELKTPGRRAVAARRGGRGAADDPEAVAPVRRPDAARGRPARHAGPGAHRAVPAAGRRSAAGRRRPWTSSASCAEAVDRSRLGGRAAPASRSSSGVAEGLAVRGNEAQLVTALAQPGRQRGRLQPGAAPGSR